MEEIDIDTNRLPRGRRYANAGRVRKIEIEKGTVRAKVHGSRPRPYDIRIALKRFKPTEVEKIGKIIQDHPEVASELHLGRLPERLLDLLHKARLPLLPTHWDELASECSCPDWANPCKHLAAVYYLLANEIDKDPFILLGLRGVDREAIGGAVTFSTGQEGISEEGAFIPYQDVALSDGLENGTATSDSSYLKDAPSPPDLSFERLPIETLFSLLPDRPLFYPESDFKRILLQAYQNVVNAVENTEVVEEKPPLADVHLTIIHHPDEITFFIVPPKGAELGGGRLLTREVPTSLGDRMEVVRKRGRSVSPEEVLNLFLRLPMETTLASHSPSARALNVASSLALALARAASFIPQVVFYREGDFSVRYLPLIHAEKEKEGLRFLVSILPPDLIFRAKDGALLTGEGAATYLLSLILTHLVRRFSGITVRDKLCDALFTEGPYLAERFEERQTGKALADWLERLSIRGREISPVVRVEPVRRRFAVQIDVENKKDPLSPLIPLSKLFTAKEPLFAQPAESVRTEVLRQIALASEPMPILREVVRQKGRRRVTLPPPEMVRFLTEAKDLLGIRVVIPKALKTLATPSLALQARLSGKAKTVSYLSLDAILDFSWKVAIEGETISKEAFLALVQKSEGLVRFRDHYLLLKPDEVRRLLERLDQPPPALTPLALLRAGLAGEIDGAAFQADAALRRLLDDLIRVEAFDLPGTLRATLRPYQKRGIRWLWSNTRKGFGVCLADDMGLGKTLQAIAFLLMLKDQGRLSSPALVVCPTTLVGNWTKECERFAPALKTAVYHGTERRMELSGTDALITTYGIVRREVARFSAQKWAAVIIDEAQNIKNPEADQTRAVKRLKSDAAIALSGTPVENRLTELWSIFDFINRDYLGALEPFKREYAIPIEKYRDREKIEKLRKITAPFLLRRLKSDKSIIADLPEKIVSEEYCALTKDQAALYQQVVERTLREIKTVEGMERRGLIFKLITSLKQICNHPVHYLKKGTVHREGSGKTEFLLPLLEKIIAAGEKVLLFTQYREMGDLLVALIERELGETPLFFHGGLPRAKRDEMVAIFQGEPRRKILILSLKAGGSGLNLTAAAHVIHYDLWWNPAVEAQATDRTYRIGQKKNVMVHRLITLGTFEEKIDAMIRAKKELSDLTVATGEQWITELSNRELKEIFRLSGGG
jgi:uncharacterized Zn finger protein/superfamily II DNA or RNA helicase